MNRTLALLLAVLTLAACGGGSRQMPPIQVPLSDLFDPPPVAEPPVEGGCK